MKRVTISSKQLLLKKELEPTPRQTRKPEPKVKKQRRERKRLRTSGKIMKLVNDARKKKLLKSVKKKLKRIAQSRQESAPRKKLPRKRQS